VAAVRRKRRGSYWQDIVLVRVRLAQHDLDHVLARQAAAQSEDTAGCESGFAENVNILLERAEEAALEGNKGWARVLGHPVSQAFVNLHAAEVLIARHSPADQIEDRLVSALARFRATMSPREPRRRELESRLADPKQDAAARRHLLATALDWTYSSTDALYARLRSFRNILYAVAVALAVLGVLLAVVGWSAPGLLSICFGEGVCPSGPAPQRHDIVLIELLGASGGALAAVVAVTQMKGTQTPYDVPLALAVLKLPLGALSALLGLMLIHGRFVPGLTDLDTSGQILAYAIFFGIAQQLVTLFVDRRGQELLNQIPSKKTSDQTQRPAAASDGPMPPDESDTRS
jgi:hypothetical protein